MILFGNMDQGRHIHWWGKKRVAERGRTRTLTVLNIHPSIHLFHTFSLALVLCRVMRLEPFLCHRQDKPLDRQAPVHHTHSHSLQSPVHLSCMSLDSGRAETNVNMERTYKLHIERLLEQLGLQYCTYNNSLY